MSEAKHTPGPWRWTVNRSTKHVRLESRTKGWMTVVDFVRWGMGGAAPRFCRNGLMDRCDELSEAIPGEEHHASWDQFINHPDARLIEAAPELLAALEDVAAVLRHVPGEEIGPLFRKVTNAISKATEDARP